MVSENCNRHIVSVAKAYIHAGGRALSSATQWGTRPRNATSKRSASSDKVLGYMWEWECMRMGVMSQPTRRGDGDYRWPAKCTNLATKLHKPPHCRRAE